MRNQQDASTSTHKLSHTHCHSKYHRNASRVTSNTHISTKKRRDYTNSLSFVSLWKGYDSGHRKNKICLWTRKEYAPVIMSLDTERTKYSRIFRKENDVSFLFKEIPQNIHGGGGSVCVTSYLPQIAPTGEGYAR